MTENIIAAIMALTDMLETLCWDIQVLSGEVSKMTAATTTETEGSDDDEG